MELRMNIRSGGGGEADKPAKERRDVAGESMYGVSGHGPGNAASDPIGAGLRRLLASVTEEPIPDEFMNLLDRLDAARADGGTVDGQDGA